MVHSLRQRDILKLARAAGWVEVEDLAQRFEVSAQTIRRDLGELADQGLLDRVHGGAVLVAGVSNLGYEARRVLHESAKDRIGRSCASMIPDNSSLILNIGTTTEAVARALLEHRNLTVVTNNMNVANTLIDNESCEVIVAGGIVRRSDGGLVGDLTSEFLANFKVDFAVVGCSALEMDGDVLDFDLAEVRVSRTILRQARTLLLVTDLSKLTRTAPVRMGSLADMDAVVTEAPLPAELQDRCAGWGTQCVTEAVRNGETDAG